MKKILFSLFALFAMGNIAFAQKVTVADIEALPGETVAFSVDLSEGKADTYTAMTLYAQFPATGFNTTGDYTVSEEWKGTMAVVGEVDETGLATIPFASSNTIAATDVEGLVTVSFKIDEAVELGEYEVALKAMFEYNSSDKDYAEDVTFKVHVVAAHTVYLDEDATEAPVAAAGVNANVKFTLNAREWNTICLPFAMNEEQVLAAFGEDVKIADFKGYEYDEEKDEIVVNSEDVTTIEANHPYIIKAEAQVTEFLVEGVDVDPQEAVNASIKRTKKAWSELIGTYVATTEPGESLLILNQGDFEYTTEATTVKAFHAYFDFYDEIENKETTADKINFSFDDVVVAINGVKQHNTNQNVYTLAGQQLKHPVKGLYIQKGKKILVK